MQAVPTRSLHCHMVKALVLYIILTSQKWLRYNFMLASWLLAIHPLWILTSLHPPLSRCGRASRLCAAGCHDQFI